MILDLSEFELAVLYFSLLFSDDVLYFLLIFLFLILELDLATQLFALGYL